MCSVEELILFPYVKECIRAIHEKGYYAIVITNQSGVARGFFSEHALQEMNTYLMRQIDVDAVYFCPHLENGKVKEYSFKCTCRKPQIGMIERACRDFPIDLKRSYMVGDRISDILTGKNAGTKTVLLKSSDDKVEEEELTLPDYLFHDLRQLMAIL